METTISGTSWLLKKLVPWLSILFILGAPVYAAPIRPLVNDAASGLPRQLNSTDNAVIPNLAASAGNVCTDANKALTTTGCIGGGGGVTGSGTLGQPTVWSGSASITAASVTVPILDPVFAGFYIGYNVNYAATLTNKPYAAFDDESTIAAANAIAQYSSYYSQPTFNGTDVGVGGGVQLTGFNSTPSYSGTATAGSGSSLFGASFSASFKGTGTLDRVIGLVAGVGGQSGTVTNAYGVQPQLQLFAPGAVTNYYAFYDPADSSGHATNAFGYYQVATNHPNKFASTIENDTLGASLLVCTNGSKVLVTAGCPSGTVPAFVTAMTAAAGEASFGGL